MLRCSAKYVYVGRKIPRSNAYAITEKAIRFQHPDYNTDRVQKLISSSMSRHISTRNTSSKFMRAFLSNLANRQTDKRTRANAFTSSFVGGNKQTYSSKHAPELLQHFWSKSPTYLVGHKTRLLAQKHRENIRNNYFISLKVTCVRSYIMHAISYLVHTKWAKNRRRKIHSVDLVCRLSNTQ